MKKKSSNTKFFSKVLPVLKNPFFIIGFILLLSIIIYLIISYNLSGQSQNIFCDPKSQTLCSGQCIDNNNAICTTKGEICKLTKYCPDEPNECCNDDESCNINTQKCQKCTTNKFCGTTCCQSADDECIGDTCCNKDSITTDNICCNESEGGQICKSLDGKKTTCCSGKAGEVCDKNKGICVQGCPDVNNTQYYKCHGTPVPLPSQSILCGPNEICTVDCASDIKDSTFKCAANTCNWSPIDYNPDYLKDPNNPNTNYKFNGEDVAQCIASDGKTIWLQYNRDDLTATAKTHSLDATPDPVACSLPMCVNKIQQYDTANIERDFTQNADYSCDSNLNCKKSLFSNDKDGYNNLNEVCSTISNKNVISPNRERCCKDSNNKYTGQLCNSDEFCDSDQTCNLGFYFDSTKSQCIPTNDKTKNPQTFNNCLLSQSVCAGKCSNISDWRQCYCCPDWKPQCEHCAYTYLMPAHDYPFTKAELSSVLSWCYSTQTPPDYFDHILYIYVPSQVEFTTDHTELYYNNTQGSQIISKHDSGLPFDTTVHKFCSKETAMDFNITLDTVKYAIQTTSSQGNWSININYNNKDHKNTDNSIATPFNDINALARIGNNSVFGGNPRPGMIWISPINPNNNYINVTQKTCPGQNVIVQPTEKPTSKSIYTNKKIIFLIVLIFILIISLIIIYFFIKKQNK